ncbi:MAG: FxsA family protein [Actinomycetota bacterium]
MVLLALALLIILPLAEIASVIWVAHMVGVLSMLGLLVLVSLVGAVLAKHAGLGTWRRFRATLAAGDIPSGEVFDGVLILLAGTLLIVPGFLTDILGLLLLVPAVRSVVKWLFWRRMRRKLIELTERTNNRAGPRRVSPLSVQSMRIDGSGTPTRGIESD